MTRTTTRLAASSSAVLLALSLAGCSDNDGNDRDGAPAAEQSTSAPADPTTSASTDGSSSQLVAAGALVLGKVSGATLTSIEQDNGGWEVTVAADDGSATDATTNAEGTEITRGPTKDDDDADDLAERKRELGAATLDYEAAASAVTKAQPGTIRELNLDTRDNSSQVVWEADVRDASGNQVSVNIDAKTGAVVSKASDDDSED
ncbi:hypothetical protein GCM10011519_25330 [Marmoricola endophyticus]|uniref:PepSY domain-containing protein n=1 Tax=Marmoricola endophyticus TaxID=2040280 RepID=A0A917BLH0_9ACTN|nr:PepSY domain-containing protein [Marmoricola endophyticus]GGF50293.1 hypothetical protein GCM10011519_25330 [Marmoricola endophyticus]